jgi:rhodanese-related sulfurtransferase
VTLGGSHPLLEEVTSADLAAELATGGTPLLVDVRTDMERAIASIEPSLHIELSELTGRAAAEIPLDADVVLYCHTGRRSAQAAVWLRANGWSRTRSLAGGIDEWSLVVDPRVQRY